MDPREVLLDIFEKLPPTNRFYRAVVPHVRTAPMIAWDRDVSKLPDSICKSDMHSFRLPGRSLFFHASHCLLMLVDVKPNSVGFHNQRRWAYFSCAKISYGACRNSIFDLKEDDIAAALDNECTAHLGTVSYFDVMKKKGEQPSYSGKLFYSPSYISYQNTRGFEELPVSDFPSVNELVSKVLAVSVEMYIARRLGKLELVDALFND